MYARKTSLNINISKSKVIFMKTSLQDPTTITTNGNPIENVYDFPYLGSILNIDDRARKISNLDFRKHI